MSSITTFRTLPLSSGDPTIESKATCRCSSVHDTAVPAVTSPVSESEDAERELLLRPKYGVASKVCVRYRLVGPANAPVVVVQGGISASRAACDLPGTPVGASELQPWWPEIVGEQRAIDTRRFRVLCLEWLVPADFVGPAAAQCSAPRAVTTSDQADALAALLTELGIPRVAAHIGSSYGGMVGLAFAARHPRLIDRLIAISATHRSHPYSTALRLIQRRIVRLGQSHGLTNEALALSRQLAMTTFRTPEEYRDRFDNSAWETPDGFGFEVADYLSAVGEKFTARFDADRFVALSESIDLHDVDPGAVEAPTTLIAVRSDQLIRPGETRQLGALLSGPHYVHEIDSLYGHDAFLKESRKISKILRQALN